MWLIFNRELTRKARQYCNQYISPFLGIEVICAGDPGHGSRFIENDAGTKMVGVMT